MLLLVWPTFWNWFTKAPTERAGAANVKLTTPLPAVKAVDRKWPSRSGELAKPVHRPLSPRSKASWPSTTLAVADRVTPWPRSTVPAVTRPSYSLKVMTLPENVADGAVIDAAWADREAATRAAAALSAH